MKKPASDWDLFGLHGAKLHFSSWSASAAEKGHALFVLDQAEDESAANVGFEHLPTILANRLEQVLQLRRLEESLEHLSDRIQALEGAAEVATTFYVQTFAPEPYRVMKPIPVAIHKVGEEFVATFADANINSSGDNPQEAFANVKELILDSYDRLSSLPAEKLGPGPMRQLAVLRDFIDAAQIDHEGTRREDR